MPVPLRGVRGPAMTGERLISNSPKRKDVGQVANPPYVSVTAFFQEKGAAQGLMPICCIVWTIRSTANSGVTLAVLMVRSKSSGECASRPK